MIYYELWEYRTSNLVNTYDTEAEALADVRALLAQGWQPEQLGLGWGDTENEERGGAIAEGQELAERAQAAGPGERKRVSA